MSKKNILLQLDVDPQPSVFDAVVAVDADVDVLLRHHAVAPNNVTDLVHGAIFTRGPKDLHHTAIFIGGSDVAAAERLLAAVRNSFFGPMCVSVMMDANGANTTAAAAVLVADAHLKLDGIRAAVLGATGPVGHRVVRLLARHGAIVQVVSRSLDRAQAVCDSVAAVHDTKPHLTPVAAPTPADAAASLAGVQLLVAAGAAGVTLIDEAGLSQLDTLQLAIDLNAVPPGGIAGIDAQHDAHDLAGVKCFGAIAVGGKKMRIHKAAINTLFKSNDACLDADEIFDIGRGLGS